jgi:very-short-patch-repair endonuclease
MTYRDMFPLLGTTYVPAIRAMLEKYGIPIRRGSDAVRHQWVRNPDRKEKIAKIFRASLLERSQNGSHWAKGFKKESHQGLAAISDKLRESGRLLTSESLRKAAATRKANHRADPTTHVNAKAKPTRVESLFMEWLGARGARFEFQKSLQVGESLYFADFFLPDANLAIEVTNSHGRVPNQRLKDFTAAGWKVIAVLNSSVDSGNLALTENAIANAYAGEFNPATVGECWMIRRNNNCSARRKLELQELLR